MKRVITALCCMFVSLSLYAEVSPATLKMLKDASVAEGSEYIQKRNNIIKKATAGEQPEEFLAELKDAAEDEALSWQIRLMANICVERVEHGDEIEKIIHYKWKTHPDYDKELAKSIVGPINSIGRIIPKELKKKKMWFYYLEGVWKKTKECDTTVPRLAPNWSWFCLDALTDSPESYYLFRILENEILQDPKMGKYDTQQTYMYLIKHADKTSIKFLLERLDASGFCKTGYFEMILPKAKKEDMEYLKKYGKETRMKATERTEFDWQIYYLNKKFGLPDEGKPKHIIRTE